MRMKETVLAWFFQIFLVLQITANISVRLLKHILVKDYDQAKTLENVLFYLALVLIGVYISFFCYVRHRLAKQAFFFYKDIKSKLIKNFIAVLGARILFSVIRVINIMLENEVTDRENMELQEVNRFLVILAMIYVPQTLICWAYVYQREHEDVMHRCSKLDVEGCRYLVSTF